jgi:hypothetical protein
LLQPFGSQEYAVDELSTIRVNDNARVELKTLSSGETYAVIDNFLERPDDLRAYAAKRERDFYMPPKSYPGVLLDIDKTPMQEIYRFIRSTLARQFRFYRGNAELMSMLSLTTLKPDELSNLQRLCHSDPPAKQNRRNYAFVLYLFDNEQLGGTGFYRWKEKQAIIEATALELTDPAAALSFLKERFPTYQKSPCYITESTEIAERLDLVAAKYNRLIFYPGDLPHSAQISSPELLTNDVQSGRLTLNCFASVRPI